MGTRGPLPRRDSKNSRMGRNTLYRIRPAAPVCNVAPPDNVARDPAALRFWQEHAPQLIAAKRLRPEHAVTFGVVCQLAADCQALAERITAEGAVVSTGRGMKAHPACRLLRDARRDFFTFAGQFGLTAVTDARLPAEPPNEPPDELAVFLASPAG